MSSEQAVLSATKKWLQSVVIAQNFCPFARRVLETNAIRYAVANCTAIEPALFEVAGVCELLDEDNRVETALLILPDGFGNFDDYLDLLAAAEAFLCMSGYAGVYQIASFHPHYCFAGTAADDAANYTNRSPYPLLHLLRESSVDKAVETHANVDSIPANNIQHARELGVEMLQASLDDCHQL